MSGHYSIGSKIVALFLVATFVSSDLSYGQGVSLASPRAEMAMPRTFGLAQAAAVQVPENLAMLDQYHAGQDKMIFHIQNAHGNYEGEKKTEALLVFLKEKYGVETIFTEGAWNKLNPDLIRFVPDEKKNAEILDQLTKKAAIKGFETYLLNDSASSGYGIEEEALYNQGLRAFAAVHVLGDKYAVEIKKIETALETQQAKLFSSDLRSLVKRIEKHRLNQVSFDSYLDELRRATQKHFYADLGSEKVQLLYPQLVRIFKIKEMEKKIDSATFEKEKPEFLKAVKGSVPDATSGEQSRTKQRGLPPMVSQLQQLLNLKDLSANLPNPGTVEFFAQLVQSLPENFDYKPFGHVTRFFGLLMLRSEINPEMLIQEISKLESELMNKLADSSEAKDLVRELEQHWLFEKLIHLELTPSEYEQMNRAMKRGADSDSSGVAERLPRGVTEVHSEVAKLVEQALNFYEIAQKRDEVMLRRIEERLRETKAEKVAVITGGFHAGPFEEYFKKKNYSYAKITPRLTDFNNLGREEYINMMMAFAKQSFASQVQKSEIKNQSHNSKAYNRSEAQTDSSSPGVTRGLSRGDAEVSYDANQLTEASHQMSGVAMNSSVAAEIALKTVGPDFSAVATFPEDMDGAGEIEVVHATGLSADTSVKPAHITPTAITRSKNRDKSKLDGAIESWFGYLESVEPGNAEGLEENYFFSRFLNLPNNLLFFASFVVLFFILLEASSAKAQGLTDKAPVSEVIEFVEGEKFDLQAFKDFLTLENNEQKFLYIELKKLRGAGKMDEEDEKKLSEIALYLSFNAKTEDDAANARSIMSLYSTFAKIAQFERDSKSDEKLKLKGHVSDRVKALQDDLKELDKFSGVNHFRKLVGTTDGKFGPDTEEALRSALEMFGSASLHPNLIRVGPASHVRAVKDRFGEMKQPRAPGAADEESAAAAVNRLSEWSWSDKPQPLADVTPESFRGFKLKSLQGEGDISAEDSEKLNSMAQDLARDSNEQNFSKAQDLMTLMYAFAKTKEFQADLIAHGKGYIQGPRILALQKEFEKIDAILKRRKGFEYGFIDILKGWKPDEKGIDGRHGKKTAKVIELLLEVATKFSDAFDTWGLESSLDAIMEALIKAVLEHKASPTYPWNSEPAEKLVLPEGPGSLDGRHSLFPSIDSPPEEAISPPAVEGLSRSFSNPASSLTEAGAPFIGAPAPSFKFPKSEKKFDQKVEPKEEGVGAAKPRSEIREVKSDQVLAGVIYNIISTNEGINLFGEFKGTASAIQQFRDNLVARTTRIMSESDWPQSTPTVPPSNPISDLADTVVPLFVEDFSNAKRKSAELIAEVATAILSSDKKYDQAVKADLEALLNESPDDSDMSAEDVEKIRKRNAYLNNLKEALENSFASDSKATSVAKLELLFEIRWVLHSLARSEMRKELTQPSRFLMGNIEFTFGDPYSSDETMFLDIKEFITTLPPDAEELARDMAFLALERLAASPSGTISREHALDVYRKVLGERFNEASRINFDDLNDAPEFEAADKKKYKLAVNWTGVDEVHILIQSVDKLASKREFKVGSMLQAAGSQYADDDYTVGFIEFNISDKNPSREREVISLTIAEIDPSYRSKFLFSAVMEQIGKILPQNSMVIVHDIMEEATINALLKGVVFTDTLFGKAMTKAGLRFVDWGLTNDVLSGPSALLKKGEVTEGDAKVLEKFGFMHSPNATVVGLGNIAPMDLENFFLHPHDLPEEFKPIAEEFPGLRVFSVSPQILAAVTRAEFNLNVTGFVSVGNLSAVPYHRAAEMRGDKRLRSVRHALEMPFLMIGQWGNGPEERAVVFSDELWPMVESATAEEKAQIAQQILYRLRYPFKKEVEYERWAPLPGFFSRHTEPKTDEELKILIETGFSQLGEYSNTSNYYTNRNRSEGRAREGNQYTQFFTNEVLLYALSRHLGRYFNQGANIEDLGLSAAGRGAGGVPDSEIGLEKVQHWFQIGGRGSSIWSIGRLPELSQFPLREESYVPGLALARQHPVGSTLDVVTFFWRGIFREPDNGSIWVQGRYNSAKQKRLSLGGDEVIKILGDFYQSLEEVDTKLVFLAFLQFARQENWRSKKSVGVNWPTGGEVAEFLRMDIAEVDAALKKIKETATALSFTEEPSLLQESVLMGIKRAASGMMAAAGETTRFSTIKGGPSFFGMEQIHVALMGESFLLERDAILLGKLVGITKEHFNERRAKVIEAAKTVGDATAKEDLSDLIERMTRNGNYGRAHKVTTEEGGFGVIYQRKIMTLSDVEKNILVDAKILSEEAVADLSQLIPKRYKSQSEINKIVEIGQFLFEVAAELQHTSSLRSEARVLDKVLLAAAVGSAIAGVALMVIGWPMGFPLVVDYVVSGLALIFFSINFAVLRNVAEVHQTKKTIIADLGIVDGLSKQTLNEDIKAVKEIVRNNKIWVSFGALILLQGIFLINFSFSAIGLALMPAAGMAGLIAGVVFIPAHIILKLNRTSKEIKGKEEQQRVAVFQDKLRGSASLENKSDPENRSEMRSNITTEKRKETIRKIYPQAQFFYSLYMEGFRLQNAEDAAYWLDDSSNLHCVVFTSESSLVNENNAQDNKFNHYIFDQNGGFIANFSRFGHSDGHAHVFHSQVAPLNNETGHFTYLRTGYNDDKKWHKGDERKLVEFEKLPLITQGLLNEAQAWDLQTFDIFNLGLDGGKEHEDGAYHGASNWLYYLLNLGNSQDQVPVLYQTIYQKIKAKVYPEEREIERTLPDWVEKPDAEENVQLADTYGLHFRIAAGVIDIAKRYPGTEIGIIFNGKFASALSITGLALLEVTQRTNRRVHVVAAVSSAQEAAGEISEYLKETVVQSAASMGGGGS